MTPQRSRSHFSTTTPPGADRTYRPADPVASGVQPLVAELSGLAGAGPGLGSVVRLVRVLFRAVALLRRSH